MPCYDGRDSDEYREHNSQLAEWLCMSMKAHEANFKAKGFLPVFPKGLLEWWEEHKKRDALRDTPHA